MGSALLETPSATPASAAPGRPPQTPAPPASAEALRQQVAERLAAHRSRRGSPDPAPAPQPAPAANSRSARIAAAVAERYAHSQSYRAFLAAEAERAVQQARAAAEIAALNAQAVAAAQQQLLDSMHAAARPIVSAAPDGAEVLQGNRGSGNREEGTEPLPAVGARPQNLAAEDAYLFPELTPAEPKPRPHHHRHSEPRTSPNHLDPKPVLHLESRGSNREPQPEPGFTVRLYEDSSSPLRTSRLASTSNLEPRTSNLNSQLPEDPEARVLDEEIAFRQAPVFEEPAGPPMPLPANLIEFPRQLVASRKARPRYAEGPLREDDDEPAAGQLRIFEVDPAQISTQPDPEPADETPAAQWTAIWLDTPAATPAARPYGAVDPTAEPSAQGAPRLDSEAWTSSHSLPDAASIGRRIFAAAINGAILTAAIAAFAAAALAASGHSVSLRALRSIHVLIALLTGRAPAPDGLSLNVLLPSLGFAVGFLYLLYQTLFFSLNGATPGMRVARIALCTFSDENPTRSAARRRMLAILLSGCPLGLGFLWATLDEDRLSWHDRICRIYQRNY